MPWWLWTTFERGEFYREGVEGGGVPKHQAGFKTRQMQRLHAEKQGTREAGVPEVQQKQTRMRILKESLDAPKATLLHSVCVTENQRPVALHRLQRSARERDVFEMVGTPCKQNKNKWKATLQHVHGRIRESTEAEKCRNFRTGLETQVDSRWV